MSEIRCRMVRRVYKYAVYVKVMGMTVEEATAKAKMTLEAQIKGDKRRVIAKSVDTDLVNMDKWTDTIEVSLLAYEVV